MPFNQHITLSNLSIFSMEDDGKGENWKLNPLIPEGVFKSWADGNNRFNAVLTLPDVENTRLVLVHPCFNATNNCTGYWFEFVGSLWNEENELSFWESYDFVLTRFNWEKLAAEKQWRNVVEYLACNTTLKTSEKLAVQLWLARNGVAEME